MLCVQETIQRENLKKVPFTHASGSSRYQPIPHHILADTIVNETSKLGLNIKSEKWGIAHDDASLFGEIVLEELVFYKIQKTWSSQLGFVQTTINDFQ